MNNPKEEPFRQALEKEYKEIKTKAENMSSLGAEYSKRGAELSDVADLGIQVVKFGSPNGDWETAIEDATRLNWKLRSIDELRNQSTKFFLSIGSSTTSVVHTSAGLVSGSSRSTMPFEDRGEAEKISSGYFLLVEKYNYRDEVLRLMSVFGLVKTQHGKTAIGKFKAGWEAHFQNPPKLDSSISSVIPLRESIDLVVDELVWLRPIQRPAKPRKIMEIGSQLGADVISPKEFEEMENEFIPMKKKMAVTKDNFLTRERELELMIDGTLFLKRLLSALDPNKLRV